MSFQDMGKRRNVSDHLQLPNNTTTTCRSQSPKHTDGRLPPSGNGLLEISEELNQYQRNVGILDRIVQQLSVCCQPVGSNVAGVGDGGGVSSKELQLQYDVQADVVMQLEGRVERHLSTARSNAPQIVKMKRDFERVQRRVKGLKAEAAGFEKQRKTTANSANGAFRDGGRLVSSTDAANALQTRQQTRLQMQEDRLAEEIMREREEEIRKINRGMHQVHEIYKDLAHIVGSQQEQIDVVESQMEESRVNAEQGLKQVERANENHGNVQCTIS